MKELKTTLKLHAYLLLLTIILFEELDLTMAKVKTHLKYIMQRIPDDIDSQINDILTQLTKDKMLKVGWAKIQLELIIQGVPLQDDSSLLEKLLATNKEAKNDVSVDREFSPLSGLKANKECEVLFSMLNLIDFYTQKMTLNHALQVRENTLDIAIADGAIAQCSDPNLYPFLILQKIMSFDYRCRVKLICTHTAPETPINRESDDDSSFSDSDLEDDEENECIHPMDGLVAVLHCADNFLRQDLLSRLTTCQIAIPLLLPNPFTEELIFTLWATRAIVKGIGSRYKEMIARAPLLPRPID